MTGSPVMYPVVFTQLIAPEYGDGEPYWYVQKEFELPFTPNEERTGYIIPDLGPYIIHVNWIHFDMNDGKFYLTIQADWVQVWINDSEYDHTATQMKLEKRLVELQEKGWTLRKRPKEEF